MVKILEGVDLSDVIRGSESLRVIDSDSEGFGSITPRTHTERRGLQGEKWFIDQYESGGSTVLRFGMCSSMLRVDVQNSLLEEKVESFITKSAVKSQI